MTKKLIGIPGWSTGEGSWGVAKSYLEYFSDFGKVVILSPDEENTNVDLVVLPGGMDMNPRSYGAVPGFKTGNTDVFKQFFFDVNLPQYVQSGTSIFGICLG